MPTANVEENLNNEPISEDKSSTGSVTARLANRTSLIRAAVFRAIMDLATNKVYTYASAIAFNALLSFFPFVVLLLVIFLKLLRWPDGYEMILSLLKDEYLPAGGQFITRNLRVLATSSTTATFSLGALLFTSAGIFAPIELALNHAWGIKEERHFALSQLVALLLVIACGVLAMGSIYVTASSQSILQNSFGSAAHNPVFKFFLALLLKIIILPVTITIFFLIYYVLPNKRVPLKRVLSVAIFVGLLWELSKYFFVWCLPILDFASVYGPFYITISLVMWAFISSLIMLFGANLSAKWPE
jgi:membrane protein